MDYGLSLKNKMIQVFFVIFISVLNSEAIAVEKVMKKELFIYEAIFDIQRNVIPILLFVENGSSIYKDYKWQLEMLSLVVDGVELKKEKSFRFLDDLNVSTIAINGDAYIYNVDVNEFMFGSLGADGNYKLWEYTMPIKFSVIEFEYAVQEKQRPFGNVVYKATIRK